jgi:hypothetical protein
MAIKRLEEREVTTRGLRDQVANAGGSFVWPGLRLGEAPERDPEPELRKAA